MLERIEKLERSIAEMTREVYALKQEAEHVAEQEQHKAPELVYELDTSGQFVERECWFDHEIIGKASHAVMKLGAGYYDLLELRSLTGVKWIGLGHWNDGLQG